MNRWGEEHLLSSLFGITEIFPLEQADEAHRRLESGATMGKLLLRI